MKAFIFVSFLLVAIQSLGQKSFIEITGGLTSSTFKGNEEKIFNSKEVDFIRRYSGNLGILFNVKTSQSVSVKFGASFNSRGTGIETFNSLHYIYFSAPSTWSVWEMNYLEFPFLLSFGPENVTFNIGPQLSTLLSSQLKGLNKTDIGLKWGLGMDTNSLFIFRTNFYTGFSNLLQTNQARMRNGYYEFSIGLKIPFDISSPEPNPQSVQKKVKKKKKDDGVIPKHREIDW